MTRHPAPTQKEKNVQRKQRQYKRQADFLKRYQLPTAPAIVTWLERHPTHAAALAAAMKEETK